MSPEASERARRISGQNRVALLMATRGSLQTWRELATSFLEEVIQPGAQLPLLAALAGTQCQFSLLVEVSAVRRTRWRPSTTQHTSSGGRPMVWGRISCTSKRLRFGLRARAGPPCAEGRGSEPRR